MSTISADTKIRLGLAISAALALIAITKYLAGIESQISQLRLLVEGRLAMCEYRLDQLDPGAKPSKSIAFNKALAIPGRMLNSVSDIKEDE
jgi:hypothetical protein